ncbi:MAG UNVERIFIED_CONTAM: IS30 family transposase [Rickettsiaceae bacterium]|jgi:IS30 family transposase
MCKKYTHLTLEERCIIYGLKSNNYSIRSIAQHLDVSPSTISRELKRNRRTGGYRPNLAHNKYQRRKAKAVTSRAITPEVRASIIYGLSQYHSPEQISGSLKLKGINISHESIYNFIWNDKNQGGELYRYLRRKGRKYNKRSSKNAGRGHIPARIDISMRPQIVETKSRIGDWEADTVIGANHKEAIVTLVDRCSKKTLLKKVPNKTKEVVTKAILELLLPYKEKVHTITFDNGGEFANHEIIAQVLDAKCYFATPYHSWERGLNEHTNGLLRQFIPKKTEFTHITDKDIEKYQNLLDNRPRKILQFNTPIAVFLSDNVALAA